MNKADLQNLCTAPPREWLAIPKDLGTTPLSYSFTLADVWSDESGKASIWTGENEDDGEPYPVPTAIHLSDCHLCAGTGYVDSKGSKVYGGQLVKCYSGEDKKTTYWTAHWDGESWGMRLLPTGDSFDMMMSEFFDGSCETTNIGHIHIPSEWPEEVRELFEMGAK